MIFPPSAERPDGAVTLIISSLTISKSVTLTPSGNTISRTFKKSDPLMVIGCPATTFVGKNTFMPSPMSADPLSSIGLHAEKAPIKTADRTNPKYLIIFFIFEILIID